MKLLKPKTWFSKNKGKDPVAASKAESNPKKQSKNGVEITALYQDNHNVDTITINVQSSTNTKARPRIIGMLPGVNKSFGSSVKGKVKLPKTNDGDQIHFVDVRRRNAQKITIRSDSGVIVEPTKTLTHKGGVVSDLFNLPGAEFSYNVSEEVTS